MGFANYKHLALICAFALAGTRVAAQVVRPAAHSVAVTPVRAGLPSDNFMTFTLSGGAVNFTLVPGSPSNPGTSSININLTWSCPHMTPSLDLYAYFNNPAAALTDGAGNNIPPSAILVSSNGGALQRINRTLPFGAPNAGLHLASVPGIGGQRGGSHTEVLNFSIDLSGAALNRLPPGTYTGTLVIQGQAQ